MKNIIVSNVTYQMIAKAALGEFKGKARQTPSGMWIMPLEDDTFAAIKERVIAGETLDDTIQRIIMVGDGAAVN